MAIFFLQIFWEEKKEYPGFQKNIWRVMQENCPQIVGRTLGWTDGGKIFPCRSQFPSSMADCAVPDINKFKVNLTILCLVCCLVIKESVHRSILQIHNQKLSSQYQLSFFVLPLLLNQC